MTREHIFSDCLLNRTPELDGGEMARKPGVFVKGDHKIKDVCATCNNVKLSETDGYICSLYDTYFHRYVQSGEVVRFEYDYSLLCRWLVKTAYNAAHANMESPVREHLSEFALLRPGGDSSAAQPVRACTPGHSLPPDRPREEAVRPEGV